MIIAKTFKGYGIKQAQDKESFHGKAFKREELDALLAELAHTFAKAAQYKETKRWQPRLPNESERAVQINRVQIKLPDPTYEQGKAVPTRKAYGQALTALGTMCENVVSLDGDVKNSTFAELFEQKFPDRFFQCFVAEQNMVSMAVGFNRRGKMPFVSTFGCFMSRAHDQIRMAAIGQSTLHLVGSHAGVSIGEDGPSQMALEDIALMRALPESIVLYPSDAVSTWKLVEQMARYDKGISYLRTTRGATTILYTADEEFLIGGCKVLRHDRRDRACIIGAGITVFEALAAYETLVLQDKPIFVSVIDLYSIKPLDAPTIIKVAQASGSIIITVEDHYPQGGLGEAVTAAVCNENIHIERLAVDKLPRSGKPEELLAYTGIDRSAIIKKILELI
jgi:transketolase